MKYLKLSLVFAVIAISFSACKKEKNKDSIIGTWNAKMLIQSFEMNGQVEADTVTFSPDQYLRITFMADNKVKAESNVNDDFETENGYYGISGNQLTLGESADDPDKETYDYQLSGSKLTLSKEQTETAAGVTFKYKQTIHLAK